MADDVPIRCSCGRLTGVVRGAGPRSGNHVKCYCDDCQSFQHALGAADAVLDEHGGTEIFQMSPGSFELSSGEQHLACMRLRPGGTCRWYASCCNTPLGNTMATPKLPFVGVICACLDAGSGRSLEQVLGPVKAGVFGRYARGKPAGFRVYDKVPITMMLGFVGKMLRWRLGGDHKRSPFFDADGRLSVRARVLSSEELKRVEQSRDAWPAH